MRKVILYMATSIDGFIEDSRGNTPWSDDELKAYTKFIRSCDVCIVGHTTYSISKSLNDLDKNVRYIVASKDKLDGIESINIESEADLPDVNRIGIIGGGELNGRLMGLGLIDEIILDIEPLVFGQGKGLFANHKIQYELKLSSSIRIGESTIQNSYIVTK